MTYDYGDVGPVTNTTSNLEAWRDGSITFSFTPPGHMLPLMATAKLQKDDDDYRLYDYNLEGITLSVTELKEGKATRGHSHDDAEVYFLQSDCVVRIGHKTYECKKGQVLMVAPRQYHRVYALPKQTARFVCVFSGTREAKKARYQK